MTPKASTLMKMFGDDTPIGKYSEQCFEESYDCTASLEDRIQRIITYALNAQREENGYWMVSPYGGEDITIYTVAELATAKAIQKGFTDDEKASLRKALLDGGYLEEEIREYTDKYRAAYIQLQTLRRDFLMYEVRTRQIDDKLAEMYSRKQKAIVEIQNQQTRYTKAQEELRELTTLMWLLHPFRSANRKFAAMSEVRDSAKLLQDAYLGRMNCERIIDNLESVRDDPCVTPSAPLMHIYDEIYIRSAKTLHDVEIGEESARKQIAECKKFFTLYGVPEPV